MKKDKKEITAKKHSFVTKRIVEMECVDDYDNIDFMEWLKNGGNKEFEDWLTRNKYNDKNNDTETLINLAKSYLDTTNVEFTNHDLRTLILKFKRSKFIKKIKKDKFNESLKRYTNDNIFKCLFLTISINNSFENFIKDYKNHLNLLSKDYLDIYYNKSEIGISGYEIKDNLKYLDIPDNALPALIIWRHSLKEAKYISLYKLQNEDYFKLIQNIVQYIKSGLTLENIILKAKGDVKIMNDDNKGATIINQNIGVNNGNAIANANDTVINSNIGINNELSSEIDKAINKINELTELEKEQKEYLNNILKDAKRNDSNEHKEKLSDKLSAFLTGIGKNSQTVITILSSFKTIAGFFGLNILK